MTNDQIATDAVRLETRIPDDRKVAGLTYGAHISRTADGWCGYYVRVDAGPWGIARLTPADDELPTPEDGETQDEAIVRAIEDELGK